MDWEILCVVVELAMILAALAAIWIGLSRGRWWVRLSLIGGGATALWFAPNYEFLLLFTEPLWRPWSNATPGGLIVPAIVVLTVVLAGLLFVWVAWGRGHGAWRTALATLIVGLLALVPAYEMILILLFEFVTVVPPLAWVHARSRRSESLRPWQFTLRDLLLFTLASAAVLGVGAYIPAGTWLSWDRNVLFSYALKLPPVCYFLILGIEAGVLVLVAAWIALGACGLWKRLVVLLLLFPVGWIGSVWWLLEKTAYWSPSGKAIRLAIEYPGSPDGLSPDELIVLAVGATLPLTALWLALFRRSRVAPAARHDASSTGVPARCAWSCRVARASLVLLSLVFLVPLAAVYWVLAPEPIPKVVLPEPNAYVQLLTLSEPLVNVSVPKDRRDTFAGAKPQEFIDFARRHEKLLADARALLSRPGCVPLKYLRAEEMSSHCPNCAAIYTVLDQLGRAFVAAGHARCHQGDYSGGVQWYVDAIRLRRKTYEGGIWGHWLGSWRIEDRATGAIHDARNSMPRDVRQEVLKTLRDLGEDTDSVQAVMRRDVIWWQYVLDWEERLGVVFCEALPPDDRRSHQREQWNECLARRRLLMIELALENYRDDHGQYPASLAALVPDYLDRLPTNPVGGKPFRYRLADQHYWVDSVGDNEQDDDARDEFPRAIEMGNDGL